MPAVPGGVPLSDAHDRGVRGRDVDRGGRDEL